jgi:hypothetical protein
LKGKKGHAEARRRKGVFGGSACVACGVGVGAGVGLGAAYIACGLCLGGGVLGVPVGFPFIGVPTSVVSMGTRVCSVPGNLRGVCWSRGWWDPSGRGPGFDALLWEKRPADTSLRLSASACPFCLGPACTLRQNGHFDPAPHGAVRAPASCPPKGRDESRPYGGWGCFVDWDVGLLTVAQIRRRMVSTCPARPIS